MFANGNIIQMIDNTTNQIGEKNPYRYRSYYYDTETNWYYLNSRYYNPNIGRFITMDEIEYLGATSTIQSYNLFIYSKVDNFMPQNPVLQVHTLLKNMTRIGIKNLKPHFI